MQVNPYLSFNGNCEEAFNYYAKVLGGTINDMMTAENTPMAAEMPPDRVKKIMHAKITIDGEVLMASDVPPEHYQTPQGMHVSLHPSEPEEAERIFRIPCRGRHDPDADRPDVLGAALRGLRRSVRDSVARQLRMTQPDRETARCCGP